jgi:hypothetical protein
VRHLTTRIGRELDLDHRTIPQPKPLRQLAD